VATTAQSAVSGGLLIVTVTPDTGAPTQYAYPSLPPDGRGVPQWQSDCQAAALAIVADPPLGDGGPDASASIDTTDQTG